MDPRKVTLEIDSEQSKRRARWQRNKMAERARLRKPLPTSLNQCVIDQIFAERDRRIFDYPGYTRISFGAHRSGWGTHEFHCDVWAARTALELLLKHRKISDGLIANWMAERGLAHGYAHAGRSSSLRTMVGRARKAIAIREAANTFMGREPVWPIFMLVQGDNE